MRGFSGDVLLRGELADTPVPPVQLSGADLSPVRKDGGQMGMRRREVAGRSGRLHCFEEVRAAGTGLLVFLPVRDDSFFYRLMPIG